jgi:hypothetical protein
VLKALFLAVNGLTVWTVVGWAIAAGFGAVAVLNYRRSHFPSIRVTNVRSFGRSGPRDDRSEHYLALDILSFGADVYGLQVFLEARYSTPQDNSPLAARLQFDVIGTLPDPLKKGQHVGFELPHWKLRDYPFDSRDRGRRPVLRRLPTGSVAIVVYHAGRRVLERVPAGDFEEALAQFETPPIVHLTHEDTPGHSIVTMNHITPTWVTPTAYWVKPPPGG